MCWISGLLGGTGGYHFMSFHYFFQKPLPCDCFGTEYNEIIKAFVCLGHLSSFLMPFGTGKIPGLEFTMGVSINICAIICTHTITIESSSMRQILVFFSSLFLYNFFAQKHQF